MAAHARKLKPAVISVRYDGARVDTPYVASFDGVDVAMTFDQAAELARQTIAALGPKRGGTAKAAPAL